MSKQKGKILTPAEYVRLFSTMVIDAKKNIEIDRLIDQNILKNRCRYEDIRNKLLNLTTYNQPVVCAFNTLAPVENIVNVKTSIFERTFTRTFKNGGLYNSNNGLPWFVIALIHYVECSFNFNKHLFNGDPLKNYTQRFPPGYPKIGHTPPFSFEESAVAALKYKEFDKKTDWNLATILRCLEEYNGFGYELYQHMNSPYLWSGSNHYVKGKYVEHKVNGKWKSSFEANAVSQQIGTAVILKQMEKRGIIILQYS